MADEGANAMDEAVRLDNENGEEQLADNGPPIEANVDIINPGVVEGAEGEQPRPAAGSEASDADAGGRQIELQAWDLRMVQTPKTCKFGPKNVISDVSKLTLLKKLQL